MQYWEFIETIWRDSSIESNKFMANAEEGKKKRQ